MSYESWRISYQSSEAAARAAYATTEKLHAELTALREQMAAIGAGGVEPLRKARAASAETKISALMSKISTLVDKRLSFEPCAEAEEDLLQFLRTRYAAPAHPAEGVPAQAVQAADAQDAERWMGIGKAIERACMDLPGGTEIVVSLEKDAGTVTLIDQDGNEHENFSCDYGFAGVLNEAIDAAIAAQAKHEVQL